MLDSGDIMKKIKNAKGVKKMKFNHKKFSNLVHYVCYKCDDHSQLGATKLNKILWYCDIFSYRWGSVPMTGEKYIKRQFGPVPHHILTILDELVCEDKIIIREKDYFGRTKKEYIALKKPDLSLFTSNEISMVDDILDIICMKHTAQSISDTTHDKIWELAEIGEEIPYYTIFASRLGEVNEDDIKWANNALKAA